MMSSIFHCPYEPPGCQGGPQVVEFRCNNPACDCFGQLFEKRGFEEYGRVEVRDTECPECGAAGIDPFEPWGEEEQ